MLTGEFMQGINFAQGKTPLFLKSGGNGRATACMPKVAARATTEIAYATTAIMCIIDIVKRKQ
jgi:hypothetical protein